MSDFLSNDFRNFSCCSGGSFSNFTEDQTQTSSWIIAGDSGFNTIRIGLSDVSRFIIGNIVEVSGGVYSGKFELSNVIKPVGSRLGSIVLKTKFLKTSPTAKPDATYTYGYVDTSVHSVKNISMFSPLVLQYAELIRNTKGKKAGGKDQSVFDDVKWWQYAVAPIVGVAAVVWDKLIDGEGVLQEAYRRLKSGGNKGSYSVAEIKYLKTAADTAISTINNNQTKRRAERFMEYKFMKLQDSSILLPSTTGNIPTPTTNDSPVAQAGRGGSGTGGTGTGGTGTGLSAISGSNMTKYLFLAVAAVGGFFLIRSFVKK